MDLVLPRAVFAYTVSLPKGVIWRWAGMGQNLAQTFVLRQKGVRSLFRIVSNRFKYLIERILILLVSYVPSLHIL